MKNNNEPFLGNLHILDVKRNSMSLRYQDLQD